VTIPLYAPSISGTGSKNASIDEGYTCYINFQNFKRFRQDPGYCVDSANNLTGEPEHLRQIPELPNYTGSELNYASDEACY